MKICGKCKIEKSFDLFSGFNHSKDGKQLWCKSCMKNSTTVERRVEYNKRRKERRKTIPGYKERECTLDAKRRHSNREKTLWNGVRMRAEKQSIPFNLEVSDIVIPDKCPILGYKFNKNVVTRSFEEPSIDKIIPEWGYTKGNIMVISRKANTMKSNCSLEELETFCKKYLNLIKHWTN